MTMYGSPRSTGQITPADPPVVPSAGPPLSNTTTRPAPWRASSYAQLRPMIPAPMTATSASCVFATSSLLHMVEPVLAGYGVPVDAVPARAVRMPWALEPCVPDGPGGGVELA